MSRFAPAVRPTNAVSTSTVANWFGNQFVALPLAYFDSIQTVTSDGSSGTLTFSSIPQTYTHLQIRGIVSSPSSGYVGIRFNSDSGSNYTNHFLYGYNSAASSANNTAATYIYTSRGEGGSLFVSAGVIDILDYTNTNKYKTARTLTGFDDNGATLSISMLNTGTWANTNAITSISLITQSGNFNSTTTFALYGIKAA